MHYVLQAFQHEIGLNQSRLEEISEHAQVLMQRSDPLDSTIIQEDMDELLRYSSEVFDQVGRFQRKLERLSIEQVGQNYKHIPYLSSDRFLVENSYMQCQLP